LRANAYAAGCIHLMKTINARIAICAGFLLSATGTAVAAHPLWSDLAPGPYDAGFHIVQLEDPSRSWGERRTRPIPMSVWYPAAPASGSPAMPFDDYVVAFSVKPDQYVSRLSDKEKEQLRVDYAARSFGDLPRSKVDELLRTETAAHRDAPPLAGHFPLVIFSTGYRASPLTHTVTFEFLATHGYVVVSLPSLGSSPTGLTFDTHGQDEVARDVQMLVGAAVANENVDASHIAAVGFSFGGGAALLAAMQDQRISAVVSIDGMPGWHHTAPILRRSVSFDVARFRLPMMHIGIQGEPAADWSLIESLVFSERFVYLFRDAEHHDFIAGPVIASRVRGSLTEVQKRTYLTTCDRLLTFLDAFLKGDQNAQQRMRRTEPFAPYVESKLYKAVATPPSEDEFAQMVLQSSSADDAIRLFDDARESAGAPFVSEGMLRLLGDQLLENKRGGDAAKLFAAMSRAYPRSYAWIGLGRALEASGRPSEAADAYRKALATDATDFEARMRLSELAKKTPAR